MLRYITGAELRQNVRLRASMHQDRADQFARRLKWAVSVDADGWEADEYDRDDTLYVIWVLPDGTHGGSMRFLPTTTSVMVNDHFAGLLPEGPINDPAIWECTRFCLREGVPSHVAAALMLAGGELMRAHRLTNLLGVFDARMIRIYRMIGASPVVLGSAGEGRDKISVGLWAFRATDRAFVLRRAGVSWMLSEHWYRRSTGRPVENRRAA